VPEVHGSKTVAPAGLKNSRHFEEVLAGRLHMLEYPVGNAVVKAIIWIRDYPAIESFCFV
jgi:hypothetical protein